ncbi:uncharacterized protein LOC134686414 [Mytilus trossulus]|uniref:uncharacterized protein LOC134686414 n=1 Tax=Mytilus trossulus TaxID=6551 RepID=UPI003007D86A
MDDKISPTGKLADASKIGLLHEQIKRLLGIFLKRFVKTSVIVAHTDVTQVPFDVVYHFLPDDKLVVGLPCRGYIADHQDEIGVETEKKLYRTARNFYLKIVSKIIDKFPFSDTTLQDIAFINPRMKTKIVSDSVTKLATRFPQAIGCESTSELLDQFTEYQLLSPDDLPTFDQDISSFWGEMAEVDDIFNDKKRFNILSNLAKAFLVLPNSNADCERAFSIIKKDIHRIQI